MSENENTRPIVAATERVEAAAFSGAAASFDYSTTGVAGGQSKIADYLGHSMETALTITDLERLTGQRSREIRRQIELARRGGTLIVSDNQHGYWVTLDPAEAQQFARSMRHRAQEILKTARSIERGADID